MSAAAPLHMLFDATGHLPAGAIPPAVGEPLLSGLYDSGAFGEHTPGLRVQANMVATVDGRISGADGLSGTISTPADKRVFSVLRALASAVVVGAGTVRAERYTRLSAKPAFAAARAGRGQEPCPTLVIVSDSGRVDIDRLDSAGTSPVIVHTGPTATTGILRDLRAAFGDDHVISHTCPVEPAQVLADLRERGLTRVLTEGGPGLLGQWVAQRAVDELCLTVSPLLLGAPAQSILGDTRLPRAVPTVPRSLIGDAAGLICRFGLD
ncbi:dihydrofolate reductase family protein [Brevibacterium sp. 91QC2O2]|jgi:riboflavin biosynthesis pyrimidine reductase|uniref:dihydrofolate reductase family protein n=2 Tax=Brevibacterium TaxID=1696 RepID=UPI00211CAB1B|nr:MULTISPECIES: dihydrofolate reductase family protein [unclassified Brevibacterium]MCQ9366970.1 dihydrofolate reductase family protein [Brevibacterium sp. 91QC2O2]